MPTAVTRRICRPEPELRDTSRAPAEPARADADCCSSRAHRIFSTQLSDTTAWERCDAQPRMEAAQTTQMQTRVERRSTERARAGRSRSSATFVVHHLFGSKNHGVIDAFQRQSRSARLPQQGGKPMPARKSAAKKAAPKSAAKKTARKAPAKKAAKRQPTTKKASSTLASSSMPPPRPPAPLAPRPPGMPPASPLGSTSTSAP